MYDIGFPGKSVFPASSINPYSNNLYTQASADTPLIASISALVILGLYAIIDKVSNAAVDKFGFVRLSKIGYMYSYNQVGLNKLGELYYKTKKK